MLKQQGKCFFNNTDIDSYSFYFFLLFFTFIILFARLDSMALALSRKKSILPFRLNMKTRLTHFDTEAL